MTEELPPGYPLQWPAGWPRTKPHRRRRAPFRDTTLYKELRGQGTGATLASEMRNLGASRWVLSTDLALRRDGLPYSGAKAADPGAAVYFVLQGEEHVLACDRWDRVEHNVRAITKHVEALRGQQRWGVGTLAQAFRGYAALPAETGGEPWWKVLDVDRHAPDDVLDKAIRRAMARSHPDRHGGDRTEWDRVDAAIQAARARTGARWEAGR